MFGDIGSVGISERGSWRHGGASGTLGEVEETALGEANRRDLTRHGGGTRHQPPEFCQLGLHTGHGGLLPCPKGPLARQLGLHPHRLGLYADLLPVVPRVHGVVASRVEENLPSLIYSAIKCFNMFANVTLVFFCTAHVVLSIIPTYGI